VKVLQVVVDGLVQRLLGTELDSTGQQDVPPAPSRSGVSSVKKRSGTRTGERQPVPLTRTRERQPVPLTRTRDRQPVPLTRTGDRQPVPLTRTRDRQPVPLTRTGDRQPVPLTRTGERQPVPLTRTGSLQGGFWRNNRSSAEGLLDSTDYTQRLLLSSITWIIIDELMCKSEIVIAGVKP